MLKTGRLPLDLLHPDVNDLNGSARYMRLQANNWADALGIGARPEQPVFNNATWDFAGGTVTLWYTDSTGTEVPVTTLRRMAGETLPAATLPHHTEVAGFEFIDVNSFSQPAGAGSPIYYTKRTVTSSAVIENGRVVVTIPDMTTTGLPAANAQTTRVLFGGGGGSGMINAQVDRGREIWRDYPVIARDRGDGVILEVPFLPYPDLDAIKPDFNLNSGVAAFVGNIDNWTAQDGSTVTQPDGAGTNYYRVAGGGGISIDLDAVLSPVDIGKTVTVNFYSESLPRIISQATTGRNSVTGAPAGTNAVTFHDQTPGPHGTALEPVGGSFIYRDPASSTKHRYVFLRVISSTDPVDFRGITITVS